LRVSAQTLSRGAALALLGLIFIELSVGLADFPGLHGDEAWMGLDAIAIARHGLFSLHGMNNYTGALFSQIAAAQFSLTGISVFSLRLPGIVCNGLAVALVAGSLWKQGHRALLATVLFASSLLFLFYSRVGWEVSALQNLLLAMIFAALVKLFSDPPAGTGWTFLFFAAFALGIWNHFIFSAATSSFAITTILVALRWPDRQSTRAALLGLANLLLQAILMTGQWLVPDGPFDSHGLPALLAALLLVVAAHVAFARFEPSLSHRLLDLRARRPDLARRVEVGLTVVTAAILIFSLPLDGLSFFGTVSGYIMEARVASDMPAGPEAFAMHAVMTILLAAFFILGKRLADPLRQGPDLLLKRMFFLWTIVFFPALRVETPHALDRYYIIPQFLFFCALTLSMEDLPRSCRRGLPVVLALSLLNSQGLFWQAIRQTANRAPFDFQYGLYEETSRHFLKSGALHGVLVERGLCTVHSSSFFISEPLAFLSAADPTCRGNGAARVEYCDTCQNPPAWFAVTPEPVRSDTGSAK
jgi:hypothetical protein